MNELVQILCTRPNASEFISGVHFAPSDAGMLSEPVSRETADQFRHIPGYRIVAGDSAASPVESQVSSQRERKPGRRA